MKEKDMYEPIKHWLLNDIGCSKVYAEVANTDVLGISGACNVIVEMKTRLNTKVLEQAYRALRYAHYIYVAVPEPKNKEISFVIEDFLDKYKIGVLYVKEPKKFYADYPAQCVRVAKKARYSRLCTMVNKRYSDIRRHIKNYSEDQVGGVPSGQAITDYSITMDNIKKFMRRKDWVTVDEILEMCETHYQNPKPSVMATLKEKWNHDWCETKVEGRRRYFRYKKEASELK